MTTKATTPRYINPYLGGALLGLVLFLAFFITGNGLGASGAINQVQIGVIKTIAPAHVDQVSYFAQTGGGNKNPLAHTSVLMLLGTFAGGMLSGLINRRFKPELRKGPKAKTVTRIILAFSGGAIMGFGARMARGCTSGQALSGGAVLSVGSFAFMFAIFGAGYAMAWFLRKQWN
jgi:uncharacterized membrane protein YedE/YeeE